MFSKKKPWSISRSVHLCTFTDLEPATTTRRGLGSRDLGLPEPRLAPLVQSRGAAGEQQDDGRQQAQDGGDQRGPDGRAPGCDGVRAVVVARVVDRGLENGEGHEVGDEDDKDDEEGQQRAEGGEEASHEAGTESEEERDKCEAGGDGVQDHDFCQGARRVVRVVGEGGRGDVGLDYGDGVVADVRVAAGSAVATVLYCSLAFISFLFLLFPHSRAVAVVQSIDGKWKEKETYVRAFSTQ